MLNLMEGHKPPSTDKAQRGAYRTVWLSRMADAYGSGFDAAVLLAGWAAIEWHDLYFEV